MSGSADENRYVREPGYAERYRNHRFRARSGPRTHRRELAALVALLHGRPLHSGPWLDVPCGAGRLSDLVPQPVVQVDRDPRMLAACPARHGRPRACASALHLPFADSAFAGVLCVRLLQHLGAREQRVRVLSELARVTRQVVVLSYFEAHSLQHVRRVLGRALGRRRSGRSALPWRTVRAELLAAGLQPIARRALRPLVSEQTFVLAVRTTQPA